MRIIKFFMRGLMLLFKAINFVRVLLFNLIFLFVVLFVFSLKNTTPIEPIPNSTALWLTPKGALVDQRTFDPSLADFLNEEPEEKEILLRDLVRVINSAAKDNRIKTLVLNLNHFDGGGITKILEVGQALQSFKNQEKNIIAFSDSYSQQQYLLAAFADTILIDSLGSTFLTGFGSYREYIHEATQKLKVDFHIFKVGTYKDAVEPLMRNSMSEASKEHNSQWLNELWQTYSSNVEIQRNMDEGSLSRYVSSQVNTFSQSPLTSALFAKEANLVDEVFNRVELREYFIKELGAGKKPDQPNYISLQQYLAEPQPTITNKNNIGLIIAQGTILDGNQPAGSIGGDSLSRLIRQAGKDDSLKALMIKINSGGGSAFASEVIRQEILALRNKGLPVYVSMGNVAASGGYWIASGADKIWATPTTITGSIGVWGVYPNLSRTFNALGIHTDGVGTTELSSTFIPTLPMPDASKRIFQASVNNIYQQFLQIVAQARGMTTAQVNEIAQGRVWTGNKALELGLVDNLGTTDEAIAALAKEQALDNYEIKLIKPKLNFKEQLIQSIMEQSRFLGSKLYLLTANQYEALLYNTVQGSSLDTLAKQINAAGKKKKLSVLAHCVECTEQ